MNHLLQITGDAVSPQELSYEDLKTLQPQINASEIDPKKVGQAFPLKALLSFLNLSSHAHFLTLRASVDNFSASVPLELVKDVSWIIFSLDDQPLPQKKGGPVRFFIQNPDACQTSDIDECANVKFIDCIELSRERQQDTRPKTSEDHENLHKH